MVVQCRVAARAARNLRRRGRRAAPSARRAATAAQSHRGEGAPAPRCHWPPGDRCRRRSRGRGWCRAGRVPSHGVECGTTPSGAPLGTLSPSGSSERTKSWNTAVSRDRHALTSDRAGRHRPLRRRRPASRTPAGNMASVVFPAPFWPIAGTSRRNGEKPSRPWRRPGSRRREADLACRRSTTVSRPEASRPEYHRRLQPADRRNGADAPSSAQLRPRTRSPGPDRTARMTSAPRSMRPSAAADASDEGRRRWRRRPRQAPCERPFLQTRHLPATRSWCSRECPPRDGIVRSPSRPEPNRRSSLLEGGSTCSRAGVVGGRWAPDLVGVEGSRARAALSRGGQGAAGHPPASTERRTPREAEQAWRQGRDCHSCRRGRRH
jgi:hypothetical protein